MSASVKLPVSGNMEQPKSSKWSKVRTIIKNTSKDNVEHSSLTPQEKTFLLLLNKSKSESNVQSRDFTTVVTLAIARSRLKEDLTTRLSKLTSKEANFLRELVSNDNVTVDQLEHADHVLKTDPLYQITQEDSGDHSEDETHKIKSLEDSLYMNVKFVVTRSYNNVEVYLNGSMGTDFDPSFPMKPSEYSYKTWEEWSCNEQKIPILGIENVSPERVISPPMMDVLRKSLPFAITDDHFWLKYSMNRDGANLNTLMNSVRQSSRTLLAIETTYGEVFGAFVSSPWRKQSSFYGSCEAFLWRMKKSRFTHTYSLEEQITLEKDLDVYAWTKENRNIQFSNNVRLMIGGGLPEDGSGNAKDESKDSNDWGLGIALDQDLIDGTSSPCVTFKSPSLSQKADTFNIANMEVWSFTPCYTEDDAEKLEMGRMFVFSHF